MATSARPRSSRTAAAAASRAVPVEDLAPAPVVLVVGGEDLLAERAVQAVVARARDADPELSVHTLEAAGYASGQLGQLAGPALFGGGSLIVVQGVEAAGDTFARDALAYLASPDPEVCLVLRHSGGQRGKAILDAARKAGAPEAACLPITKDEEKVDFVTAEFRRLGRRVAPPAIRALVDAVGSDLRELAAACSQLAEHIGSTGADRVEAELVEQWFGGRVEVSAFRVADAAIAGRADQALVLLRHALDTGADPVPMVAALAAKVRGLAKVAAAGRGRAADLAGPLGMPPWQIDRSRRELTGWSDHGLAVAIRSLAEADTAIKGGGRDPVYALERALLVIATQRDAAPGEP